MFKNGQVLIQKYGGSSVESVDRIKAAALRIAEKAKRGYPMIVVVSAMGDTTDELISLIHRISTFPERRELDQVMSTGEMVSASLMAAALTELGVKAKSFNAFNLKLHSEICEKEYCITKIGFQESLERFLQPGSVAVVAGFQGINDDWDLTTLGRGGSDLTAVVMARELGQKVCEKYTDEDGIYTADPRIIPNATKVWHLSYDEMLTLANFGNGILHPRAIYCAKEANIRIHVRSSFSTVEGSVVGPDGDDSIAVKSITCYSKLAYCRIVGIKPEIAKGFCIGRSLPFKPVIFERGKDFLSFGFLKEEGFEAVSYCLETAFKLGAEDAHCYTNLTTVTLVGCGLHNNNDLTEKLASVAEEVGSMVWQSSGIRFSLAIPQNQLSSVLTKLHNSFFI